MEEQPMTSTRLDHILGSKPHNSETFVGEKAGIDDNHPEHINHKKD